MLSSQKITKVIMKRNVTIALIVSIAFAVVFLVWLGNYISKESFKTHETLSKSFQNIVDTISNTILMNEEEIDMHINSGLSLAKQLLENGNYNNLNDVKKIYQFSLSKKFVDIDVVISNKEGSIIAATGYYS
ncbi:MAG TPA: phosphohydrolase, partial [Fervidobacterium nodosum]|nr:phosphohydrolase [Fervidobacterium nodosum]